MPLGELVEKMLSQIIVTLNLKSGDRVCVMVNNLGSVSVLEIGIISSTVAENLGRFAQHGTDKIHPIYLPEKYKTS